MINKRKRILILNGPVCDEMVKETIKACTTFDGQSRVKIYLNTPGGYLNDGFAIHDLIKLHMPKSTIICNGAVMSAGVVILCAGDKRLALPNTEFMIHYGSNSSNSPNESRANARSIKQMKEIISGCVSVTPKVINDWFEKETYFSAKQALRAGLVDQIIGDEHE